MLPLRAEGSAAHRVRREIESLPFQAEGKRRAPRPSRNRVRARRSVSAQSRRAEASVARPRLKGRKPSAERGKFAPREGRRAPSANRLASRETPPQDVPRGEGMRLCAVLRAGRARRSRIRVRKGKGRFTAACGKDAAPTAGLPRLRKIAVRQYGLSPLAKERRPDGGASPACERPPHRRRGFPRLRKDSRPTVRFSVACRKTAARQYGLPPLAKDCCTDGGVSPACERQPSDSTV